jgi:transposase-like protein
MQGSKRRRLSEQAWREVLRRFEADGMSVGEFCKREGVSDSSLHRWRARLASTPSSDAAQARKGSQEKAPTSFVELGSLGATSATAVPRLDLRLDLGGGLTVHLVRI